MKIKPLIITLGSIALVGISCTSAFISYAQTDDENTGSVTEDSVLCYEKTYMNCKKAYAENLPYYEEKNEGERVTVSVSPDENLFCPLND